jgi:mono/diheme cytochrome c family protein
MRGVAAALCSLLIVMGGMSAVAGARPGGGDPQAAALKNPVKATPDSIAKGQQTFNKACRHCHGAGAKGDGPLAPTNPSPADLTDAKWDHGSTDGEIFTTISNGVGGKSEMKGLKSQLTPTEIWNIVNFLRSIGPQP